MLKNILTVTVLFTAFAHSSTFAQTQQGDRFWSIMGQYSIANPQYSNTKSTQLNASFDYQTGRFHRDNVARGWIFGLGINRSLAKFSANSFHSSTQPSIKVGYFVRRYLPITDQLRFFGQGQLTGQYQPSIFDDESTKPTIGITYYNVSAQAKIGVAYFLKNGWALEAQSTLGTASVDFARGGSTSSISSITQYGLNGQTSFSTFQLGFSRYFGGSRVSGSLLPATQESIYSPGQKYLSGGFTGNVFTLPGTNSQQASVSLSSAKFITANRARGLGLSAGFSNERSQLQYLSFGIRPFQEFYWPLENKSWSVFLNAGVSTTYNQNLQPGSGSVSVSLGAMPGVQYQFAPKWAVAATVGGITLSDASYQWNNSSSFSTDNPTRNISVTINPQLALNNFGLSLRYFPKRQL